MRYFLLLLKQSRILILFLFLEVIAFNWIVNSRSYPRAQFLSATTEVNGQISGLSENWESYLNLEVENEFLAAENSHLRSQLNSSLLIQNYGADTIGDSVLNQRYSFIPAEVVHSSHLKGNNFIIIDKGSRSGIERNMGVIGPQGVVGVVASASANFARVIPLINRSLTISAALQKENYFGPMKWPGINYRQSMISDIPRYSKVQAGDSIVTDGRSRYFPSGIPLGTVLEKELQADQNFFRLDVELSTDFANLKEVYIVKDIFRYELDSLINSSN